MSYEDEIALLKKENEMSVDDLRAMYLENSSTKDNANNRKDDKGHVHGNSIGNSNSESSDDNSDTTLVISNHVENEEDEFKPLDGNDVDDETTIEIEEKLERDMPYDEEIKLLKRENEMSVEELQSLYLSTNDEARNNGDHEKKKRKKIPLGNSNDSTERKEKRMRLDKEESTDEGAEAMRCLELADAKARNTAVSRPFFLAPWVKLREYQQIGLNWLVSTQTRRLNAILADEMGLGKTLQTISLLSYLACYKGIWGPHLIIVPTSCIVNWEMELKRFAPALKVLCYYGSAKRRKELRQGWTKVRVLLNEP
jgi:SNF2 family DNA or RNA helicase